MKTLIFEGAGWGKAKSSIESGVGNCRIRTRIRNKAGRVIYLEMGGIEAIMKNKEGFNFVGRVDSCFYVDSKWDARMNHSTELGMLEHSHFEYNKANILNWVNGNLNCAFDNMEVVNDGSVRVHDTKEPLCDCSKAGYIPFKDVEYNINLLDGIKPAYIFPSHRQAQYTVSYDLVKGIKSLNNWMADRTQTEKDEFPSYDYYVTLRWDANGIITSAEISARQNFCVMGLGSETLELVLDDTSRCFLTDYLQRVNIED